MSQDQLKLETIRRWWSIAEPGEALIKGEIDDVRWALAELTKEREARQSGADKVRSLYHGWNDMEICPIYSPQTIANIIADVAAYAGILIPGVNEDVLEGNEPNEG